MDKLELDARVARLERRVAKLTAVSIATLAIVIAGLVFLISGGEDRTAPATTTVMSAPTVDVSHAVAEHPMPPTLDGSEGSVGQLVIQLRELSGLRQKDLITLDEFNAKKDQLLSKTVRSTNLGPELEQAGDLLRANIITLDDHKALKAKILGTKP